MAFELPLDRMDNARFLERYGFAREAPHTTSRWMPSDKEQRWTENLSNPSMRRRLEGAGWTRDSISYRYNNHGFRSDDDFHPSAPSPGVMYLGCSVTEGIGLNIEDTWAHRMHRGLGGTFYNMGQYSTGIETQYRLLRAWGPVVKPSKVFVLGTIGPRREIITEPSKAKLLGPWTLDTSDATGMALVSDEEYVVAEQRTIDAMLHVIAGIEAQLYVPTWDLIMDAHGISNQDEFDVARDVMHWGRRWHQHVGDRMDGWRRIA